MNLQKLKNNWKIGANNWTQIRGESLSNYNFFWQAERGSAGLNHNKPYHPISMPK